MHEIRSDFKQWIATQLGSTDFHLTMLQGDASFRSYYRIYHENRTYVVMLAPPSQESSDLFVKIARMWKSQGLPVPDVFGWESSKGFVLLSDFGDDLLLNTLNEQTANVFYHQAFDLLCDIQTQPKESYPLFDREFILLELDRFQEWFLEKYLHLTLNQSHITLLQKTQAQLIENCVSQPQVLIHRDYHSRNLMVLPKDELGIIDFQDAMAGPVTYDLVSLLKDCYIKWPRDKVENWAMEFYQQLVVNQLISEVHPAIFLKWFDWVGLQRHLKVLGIFARLYLRDHKSNYLKDIPRVMNYVLEVTHRYPEFAEFALFLKEEVIPHLAKQAVVA